MTTLTLDRPLFMPPNDLDPQPIPLAFYGRISLDPLETKLGVQRQEFEGRERLARSGRNAEVTHVLVDNDLSGYKRNVVRPEFNRLLQLLEAGTVRGVLLYNIDRLTRQPIQLEKLIEIYERHPDYVFMTVEGDIDLSNGQGKLIARFLVAMANNSSEATSRRLKSKYAQLARAGVPTGRNRCYGWQASVEARAQLSWAQAQGDALAIEAANKRVVAERQVRIDKYEAEIIRRVCTEVRNGVTLYGIVAKLNAEGITNSVGNKWTVAGLSRLLRNPRLAGLSARYGKVIVDDAGQPVQGQWEAVLPVDEWQAMVAIICDPAKPTHKTHGGRKYFGSGVFACGKCGFHLGAKPAKPAPDGTPRRAFQCPKSSGGCGGVGVSAHNAEAWLEKLIKAHLADVVVPPAPADATWPREAELASKATKKAELFEAYLTDVLDKDTAFGQISKLEGDIKALQGERSKWVRAHPVATSQTPDTVLAQWGTMTVHERRAVVLQHIDRVLVAPTGKRGGAYGTTFDDSRFDVVWRDDEALAA